MNNLSLVLFLVSLTALVYHDAKAELVYPVDSMGNRVYDKQAYKVTNGNVIPVDTMGNRMYKEQAYKITGDKITPVDIMGNKVSGQPFKLGK